MEKLEMINSFKKRFHEELNPSIESIKYCQSDDRATVEIHFMNNTEFKFIDLNFMGGEITKNEDGTDKDILPLFDPEADIVDNTKTKSNQSTIEMVDCYVKIEYLYPTPET
jgi:hypothetical protein